MTESQTNPSPEIDVFRQQMGAVNFTLQANLAGISHEQSLIQPQPAGNCLNWVLGHLLTVQVAAVDLLGQEPVIDKARIEHYERGSRPLEDVDDAVPFDDLLAAWNLAAERVDAGLAAFDSQRLDEPAPFSPGNDPEETMGSLLAVICFHQGYHAGQTGLLRRLVGEDNAIT